MEQKIFQSCADNPMSTLKSFNFYNTNSNWYNNIPWNISATQDPSKIWKICDTQTLPFFQWQGIMCGKNLPYEEEGYTAKQTDKSAFSIFPNPTDGQLNIKMLDARYEMCYIAIFDVFGRNVFQISPSQISNHLIDVSHLPTGIYFIRITTETGTEVQKIVKK